MLSPPVKITLFIEFNTHLEQPFFIEDFQSGSSGELHSLSRPVFCASGLNVLILNK
jgi:hypothetical protein